MMSETFIHPSRLQFALTAMYHFLFAPLTLGLSFLLPSSSDPRFSLTVWDGGSSQLILSIMLWATLIFMPLIVFYTSWAHRMMAGKVR